jgi:hypothetical protein
MLADRGFQNETAVPQDCAPAAHEACSQEPGRNGPAWHPRKVHINLFVLLRPQRHHLIKIDRRKVIGQQVAAVCRATARCIKAPG